MSKQRKMAKKNYQFINEDTVYERLTELYEYINNFPDGMMAAAVRNEINYLESLT